MDKYTYLSMTTTTPFFPAWHPRLAPMGQRVQHLRRQSLMHLDLLFGSLLPSWLLAQADEGPNSREHIYSVRRTFFGFLYQVLNPACPCREVVRQIQSLFALLSSRKVSDDTGAYCTARARLQFAEGAIPPEQRQALELGARSESFEDISRALGLDGAGAAERMVRAAIERLRRRFRADEDA